MSSIRTPVARSRVNNQNARIKQGVKSGQITKEEAKQLRGARKEFRDLMKDARSDGKVTAEERKEIHSALNEMSKDIFEAKHNNDTRAQTPGVDSRQSRQSSRIKDGLQSGELTRSEMKGIRSDRQEIRQAERAAKADGVVTQEERQELQGMLNDLSKDIFEAKHNNKRRRNVFV